MGCDIHSMIEVKQEGKWKINTEKVFKNPYYDPKKTYNWTKEEWETSWPDSRNYDWFSVLANVRNGVGFAGVPTGDGFHVIAPPRGVPTDATQEWLEYVEEWDCDMHSESYLYLEDFENFDWNQVCLKRGIISINQYKELRSTNKTPDTWCGGISGPRIVVIDEEMADDILDGKIERNNKEYHVKYNWTIIYKEWFEKKLENEVEPLRKLKEKYEDVRVVFGFDN